MNLTVEQRHRLVSILPQYERKATGRRRADVVRVFEGILWVLVSGARWEDIDKRKYASYQTCHRYLQEWAESGVFQRALEALIKEGESRDLLQLHESFVDGSFVRAKKGAIVLGGATKEKAVA